MYIPHTDKERQEMLHTIGKDKINSLFHDVPEKYRFPSLKIPGSISEMEADSILEEYANNNHNTTEFSSFLGAGAYDHYIPAAVDMLIQRGDFFSAYTPYQPEISQGTLQAIFEFQSLITNLTGMEISNASHYDGATAAAEACITAYYHFRRKRKSIILSPFLHPQYREVIKTYFRTYKDVSITTLNIDSPSDFPSALKETISDQTALVFTQYPDFLGNIIDYSEICDISHHHGALFAVSTYPIALGLLVPPSDFDADFVIGEGQSLGIPLSFGGPYLGFFTTKKEFVRKISGRIVGQTVDQNGKRGFVLTLTAREQHIRRERATSNICTNQGLNALSAAIYMSLLGKNGMREVANQCYQKAHYAAQQIASIHGFDKVNEFDFFNEFVIKCPQEPAKINQYLLDHKIIGGFDLSEYYPQYQNHMLFAITEKKSKEEIDTLVNVLKDFHHA